ncbi:hypothetical protein [Novosphingobium rosa]|uniref:hypothetical protein n=1 Tax=Novosphingobium rosa TaxID=76978 RepID=UPI0012EDA628|nr:hypothetical protein [Novosphingobium rosa]
MRDVIGGSLISLVVIGVLALLAGLVLPFLLKRKGQSLSGRDIGLGFGGALAVLALGGVGLAVRPASPANAGDNAATLSSVTSTVPAAPYDVESYVYTDSFVGGIKVAQIRAIVTGDDRNRWAATIIAISQAAHDAGAESVKVTLLRNISRDVPDVLRELAHAYYNPVPNRSVWNDKTLWAIFVAQPGHIADDRTIAINQAYHEEYRKLIRTRPAADPKKPDPQKAAPKREEWAADQARRTIAARFRLPADWKLWGGNVNDSRDRFNPDSISIDRKPVADRLKELKECMSNVLSDEVKHCP